MKLNRKGVTRLVIELDKVVIKIPNFTYKWSHFLRGLIGNLSEGQTWKWNSGKYEKGTSLLLCPVVWYSWGGWILIMKKAQTLSEEQWNAMPYYNDAHIHHFRGDDSIPNYGILNEKLVKIDYADLDCAWGEDFNPSKKATDSQ